MDRIERRMLRAVDRVAARAARTFNAHVAPVAATDRPSTLPDVESEEFVKPAYYAVRRAMGRSWVNRRTETFTFVDADTVRRHMSVDFTLAPSSTLSDGDTALVPLMLLTKQNLRNLDVRNDAGEALPVLTRTENAKAAVVGLREVLRRLVEDLPANDADREIDERALGEIVDATDAGSNVAAAYLARPDPDEEGSGGSLDRQLHHATAANRSQIEALIRELEHNFLLLVPLEYVPGKRLVCRIAYDAAIRLQRASAGSSAYTRANRMLSSIGIVGRVEFFDNLAVGLCRSYHAEAVPPRDAYVAEAALTVRRLGEAVDDEPVNDDHSFRPHLRAEARYRGDEGKLRLIVHARREELVLPLALSSLLISLVLGFLPLHAYDVDGQTLSALLLVPFALSAFYIRSQENSYLTRMLRGVRMLALLPLLAAVWAIGIVALGVVPPQRGAALSTRALAELRIPFLVAASPTALLLLATVSPRLGGLFRPRIRAIQKRARAATRRRAAAPVDPGRPPARRGAELGRDLAVALIFLLLVGGVGYGGWRAGSIWWEAVEPTPARSILEDRCCP